MSVSLSVSHNICVNVFWSLFVSLNVCLSGYVSVWRSGLSHSVLMCVWIYGCLSRYMDGCLDILVSVYLYASPDVFWCLDVLTSLWMS